MLIGYFCNLMFFSIVIPCFLFFNSPSTLFINIWLNLLISSSSFSKAVFDPAITFLKDVLPPPFIILLYRSILFWINYRTGSHCPKDSLHTHSNQVWEFFSLDASHSLWVLCLLLSSWVEHVLRYFETLYTEDNFAEISVV